MRRITLFDATITAGGLMRAGRRAAAKSAFEAATLSRRPAR
ncbi:hypothetical protein ACFPOI_48145 [Nonomuraea angiospora]|uniref:Uncharacterized protein n=1 Tax=Nonomuraea angiospora TaxID=46172 RepID=A0ABR9LXM6_9ACTN|nr:hypothetical protein [Nonomuraea angiospora]MBE1585398.1 hypothetical protein [Nonomuraea angiospora]